MRHIGEVVQLQLSFPCNNYVRDALEPFVVRTFCNGVYGATNHVCRVQCFISMQVAPSAAIIPDGMIVELHEGQGIVDVIPSRDSHRTEKDAVDSVGSVEYRRGAHMQERGVDGAMSYRRWETLIRGNL